MKRILLCEQKNVVIIFSRRLSNLALPTCQTYSIVAESTMCVGSCAKILIRLFKPSL